MVHPFARVPDGLAYFRFMIDRRNAHPFLFTSHEFFSLSGKCFFEVPESPWKQQLTYARLATWFKPSALQKKIQPIFNLDCLIECT